MREFVKPRDSCDYLTTLSWAVTAILGASFARADAPCDAGFRASTPAERQTMTAVLQAAKKALPPAPAGWQIVSEDQISVPSNICKDFERRPWSYGFTRTYRQAGDYEARQKVIADAGDATAADLKKKQPRLDAIMARMTKLSQQQVALVQKGDMAGAQKINTELAKAQEEYQKVVDEGDSAKQVAAAGKEAYRDLEMSIAVRINAAAESQSSDAGSLALPPGAFAALRWNTTGESVDQGHALILFGKWTRTEKVRWNPVHRPNVAVTAAHVISVNVIADPNRLASTVQSIDFKSLAAAVAR
jgi:hypothetical protein